MHVSTNEDVALINPQGTLTLQVLRYIDIIRVAACIIDLGHSIPSRQGKTHVSVTGVQLPFSSVQHCRFHILESRHQRSSYLRYIGGAILPFGRLILSISHGDKNTKSLNPQSNSSRGHINTAFQPSSSSIIDRFAQQSFSAAFFFNSSISFCIDFIKKLSFFLSFLTASSTLAW